MPELHPDEMCQHQPGGNVWCRLPLGHHGRHACIGHCDMTWENANRLDPCTSTEVAVLGMVGEPARVRCGLLADHDGPHRMAILWRDDDRGGTDSASETATPEAMFNALVEAGTDPVDAALDVLDAVYPASSVETATPNVCPTCGSTDRDVTQGPECLFDAVYDRWHDS